MRTPAFSAFIAIRLGYSARVLTFRGAHGGNGVSAPSGSASAADPLTNERDRARERLFSGLAWAATAVFAITTPWLLIEGALPVSKVVFVGSSLLVLFTAVARRQPLGLRLGLLVLALYVASIHAIAVRGYTPNSFFVLGLLVVVMTLVKGRRFGLFSVAVTTASIFAVSWLQHQGVILREPVWEVYSDSARLSVLLRVTVIFALVAFTIVVGVSYLVEHSEELVSDKLRSLALLEREQAERARLASELVEREATFRKAQEMEILGRLSGSVAHDFNNALLIILCALDELRETQNLSPEAREAVSLIRQASDQAVATTRQLRAFGPQASLPGRRLNLADVVARTAEMLTRVLPRNIELRVEAGDAAFITSDESQIQRMVTNLVLNARDAMREGGSVCLRVLRVPGAMGISIGRVALEVEDTGSGMSDEVKKRLFEPFFTTKGGAGTGLGLASVRELLERDGGRIEVTSKVGRGTRISLSWPESSGEVQNGLHFAPAGGDWGPRGEGITVLLVDDDSAVRSAARHALVRRGFKVLDASNATEGLTVARRFRETIHVLCSDCAMSGPSVKQLIEGFRAAHQLGRVLVCSGYTPDEVSLPVEMIDAFLAKPFSGDVLAQRIWQLLVPTPVAGLSPTGG